MAIADDFELTESVIVTPIPDQTELNNFRCEHDWADSDMLDE